MSFQGVMITPMHSHSRLFTWLTRFLVRLLMHFFDGVWRKTAPDQPHHAEQVDYANPQSIVHSVFRRAPPPRPVADRH